MTEFRDVINVYHAKRAEVEAALKNTFFLYVNAPDDERDRQGYLIFNSFKRFKTERYSLFRFHVIGARSSDIKDMSEIIAYGDSEARTNYSEEGDDFHAIVAARAVSEYLKLILRSPDEPLGLAAEVIVRDEPGELIAVHYDGEYERIALDRKVWWRVIGGTHDPSVMKLITDIADRHLKKDAFDPDQLDGVLADLRSSLPVRFLNFWKMNFVVDADPVPDDNED